MPDINTGPADDNTDPQHLVYTCADGSEVAAYIYTSEVDGLPVLRVDTTAPRIRINANGKDLWHGSSPPKE